jgi:hypothetical protein
MAFCSGRELDSKQIPEKSHDSDFFSEISQDSYIDIIEHSDPDVEINRPDFSDSGGNSDDGWKIANIWDGDSDDDDDDDDDGGGGGGGDSDEDSFGSLEINCPYFL